MHRIKHRIVVFSGKGGVGKTMLSVNLAFAFQVIGKKTGILDADVTGPNVPKMVGITGGPDVYNNVMHPQVKEGVKVISIAGILSENQPLIWRGPLRSKLINQFLGDVEWGTLDYLIADLPPGTGDEIITITQKMEPDLAVIVTTPQEVSLLDAARAITMAKEIHVPRITVVENMSGMLCPYCGRHIDIFGSGGGRSEAKKLGVQFLGSIPMDIDIRKFSDEGKSIILEKKTSEVSFAIVQIAREIEKVFS